MGLGGSSNKGPTKELQYQTKVLPGLMHREHPLEHEPARVRRGYEIAQAAAKNLNPKRPPLYWRRELLGMAPLPPTMNRTFSKAMLNQDNLLAGAKASEDGECSPLFLKNTYIQFLEALGRAQHEAQAIAPGRYYELARADELTRFLMRGDVSVLSKTEVADIGEALRHVDIAMANVRKNMLLPLKKHEAHIPAPLEGALQMTYKIGEHVAAHGYRCRDNEFLPPLRADYVEPVLESAEQSGGGGGGGCAIL